MLQTPPAYAPVPIEAVTVAWLDSLWPGWHVGTTRPAGTDWQDQGGRIITVTVTGGTRTDLVVDRPLLAVEVWSPDSVEAEEAAGRLAGQLAGWAGRHSGALIYSCTPSRPRSLPDPVTGTPRYLLTAEVAARMTPLD